MSSAMWCAEGVRMGGVGLSLDRVWPLPHSSALPARDLPVAPSAQLRGLPLTQSGKRLFAAPLCGTVELPTLPPDLNMGAAQALLRVLLKAARAQAARPGPPEAG